MSPCTLPTYPTFMQSQRQRKGRMIKGEREQRRGGGGEWINHWAFEEKPPFSKLRAIYESLKWLFSNRTLTVLGHKKDHFSPQSLCLFYYPRHHNNLIVQRTILACSKVGVFEPLLQWFRARLLVKQTSFWGEELLHTKGQVYLFFCLSLNGVGIFFFFFFAL